MLRFEVKAIIAKGADEYVVDCVRDKDRLQYKFVVSGGEAEPRGISFHEDAFFFETHDDEGGLLLEWSIMKFDKARRLGVECEDGKKYTPISLSSLGTDSYRVDFEGETEENFSLSDENGQCTILSKLGSFSGKLDYRKWNLEVEDVALKNLLLSILYFHSARKSKTVDVR